MAPKRQQQTASLVPSNQTPQVAIDIDYDGSTDGNGALVPRMARRGGRAGREMQKIIAGGDAGGSVVLVRQIDPTQRGSIFAAAWSLWDSIKLRRQHALIELIAMFYTLGFLGSFGLSLLSARPIRISKIAIFDPTATGVMVASWIRPVIQRAADQMLEKQIETLSDPTNYETGAGAGLFDAPTRQIIEDGE